MNNKYKTKGYIGLANLGNTCFLNSCIQILNHIYELHSLLDKKMENNDIKNIDDSIIVKEYHDLSTLMWSENGVISPNKFVYNVQQLARKKNKDIFTGWAQNDITEFLLFIIDCIHNSISRKVKIKISGKPQNNTDKIAISSYELLQNIYSKEYSEILDLFFGIYLNKITSINNKIEYSLKPEHFFILDLQIFNENCICDNIYECFDLFVRSEEMKGENAWFNEKTGSKEDIKRETIFWNLPTILVIILKRFSPDGSQKINNTIQFPLENLDLSKYVYGYNKHSYIYDLFGVCNHMGNVNGGHYTSFVKNMAGEWIHYNDTSVELINDFKLIVSPMSYCLFYRKK